MRRIWFFNPENDLALAANRENYTAPPAAMRLRRSGEVLPLWLGAPGDCFVCSGVDDLWLADVERRFGIKLSPWNHVAVGTPEPWGWSRAARKTFERVGIPKETLPSDDMLDRYRDLSHRRTGVAVHTRLSQVLDFGVWQPGTEVSSADELESLLRRQPYSVVKLPWSSSGRGISFTDGRTLAAVVAQASGAIKRYGSVIVERRAVRIADFAMLFLIGKSCARFQGLSLFRVDEHGRYAGNYIGSQHSIEAVLAAMYSPERLQEVAAVLECVLYDVLGGQYSGPVGVDMLLARDEGGVVLHPTVEVNLRYTMGFVALALERFVDGDATFTVERGDVTSKCRSVVVDGRITSGRMALNPPGADFTFVLSKKEVQ